jgi:hypothetical protein
MNRAKTAFVLLVVFFAGCAAERILVVPPARAGTNPQARWEYQCERAAKDITLMANTFGEQGWEMVAATTGEWTEGMAHGQQMVWCFKRPLP